MRYPINHAFDVELKKEWDKMGFPKEIQEILLQIMDVAALNVLKKEYLRIAHCLVEEGLSPEKIKSITGYSVEDLYPSITYH